MKRLLLLLATALLLGTAAFSVGCGDNDVSAIKDAIQGFTDAYNAQNYGECLDYLVGMTEQEQNAVISELEPARRSTGEITVEKIEYITISDSTATATVTTSVEGQTDTYLLKFNKEDGHWRIVLEGFQLWPDDFAAANEELHQAKTAIAASMFHAEVSDLNAAVVAWDGSSGFVVAGHGYVFEANQELHTAKVAVAAAMFDGNVSDIDGGSASHSWDGRSGQIYCGGFDPAVYVSASFKPFRATYMFSDDGTVLSATLTPSPGKTAWIGVTWDTSSGGWVESQSATYDAASYLSGKFKATYDVATTGDITEGHNVSWIGVKWDSVTLSWIRG